VALARALVLNPRILLLDEPLSNLDAKIRVQMRAEIRKLQRELGITTVYVTHDQEEALMLSDRITVLNQGRVFQIGPPKELYQRPINRFVADFIGVSNLVDGTVVAFDAPGHRLLVDTPVGRLSTLYDESFKPGDSCVVTLRPENAAFGKDGGADRNRLVGHASFAAYMGDTLRYDIDVGNGRIFKVDIRDPWHHASYALGEQVVVNFVASSTVAVRPE
jgi:ABC-type Fe3+/spermidine/putrescine transport system ATPase subunit